jgi:hypothetical protein
MTRWLGGRAGVVRLTAFLAAIAVALPMLANELAQDDQPLLLQDPRYPTWASLTGILTTHYWPPPYIPALWRPLTSFALNAERLLSSDTALTAHFVSLVMYGLLAVVVAELFLRVASAPVALIAAVLFAVHPVHTEAVAVAVNQAEIMMALAFGLAICWYADARTRGDTPLRIGVGLIALQWFAAGWKETGVLLPAACAAAELLLVPDPTPMRERFRRFRPVVLAVTASTLAFIWARTAAVGYLSGTFEAAIFDGLGIRERGLTMLGVVPEWARLLLWPAHLRIDYSVQEFVAARSWGQPQTAGALILIGLLFAFVAGVRRAPAVAFGLVLAAIAIFPVHNVLFATGVLIAERTLLLPSVGVMLAALPVLDAAWRGPRATRLLLGGAALTLATLGTFRFLSRLHEWRDHRSIWIQTLQDSPKSWQANSVVGLFAMMDDRFGTGEQLLRRAIALRPRNIEARTVLADAYRVTGFCEPALAIYRGVIADYPDLPHHRIGYIACAMWLGEYAAARRAAIGGAGSPLDNRHFRGLVRLADSAIRVQAPPRSVRLPAIIASDSTRADVVADTGVGRLRRLVAPPRSGAFPGMP